MAYRAKMDTQQRAKQFAPFSALKGYEEALREKEKTVAAKQKMVEENEDQIPVPVIATFSKDGKILPLYFSVEGIRLKIDHIKWQNEQNLWGNQYRCEVTLGDRVEEVDLYYYKKNSIWTMKKKEQ